MLSLPRTRVFEMHDQRNDCAICGECRPIGSSDTAVVRCNVRKFRDESFTVWRCDACRCIHSLDRVDLGRYYLNYPFQKQTDGVVWRTLARRYIARLKSGGMTRSHAILDYGCGSGLLLKELRRTGFCDVHGFDKYSPQYQDPSSLQRTYDFVVLQDVVEHVEDPIQLLGEVAALTKEGGIICIGTPNAENIDLKRADEFIHSLHQPYHLHILSSKMLLAIGQRFALQQVRRYDTYFADTLWPFGNVRFQNYYAKLFDDNLDLAFEPLRFHWKMLTPRGLGLGLFGRLVSSHAEMMMLFRKDGKPPETERSTTD